MEIPRHWRLKQQRYGLVGEVCPHCETKIFPPRDICPACGQEAKTSFTFSGRGEVYSFTTIYEAPTGFDETAPYTVALVRLEEGPLVTAQLTDLGETQPEDRHAGRDGHPPPALGRRRAWYVDLWL